MKIILSKLAKEINQLYKEDFGHTVTPENCQMIWKKIKSLEEFPEVLNCLYNSAHGVFSFESVLDPSGKRVPSPEYIWLKNLQLLDTNAIDQIKINAIVQKMLWQNPEGNFVITEIANE